MPALRVTGAGMVFGSVSVLSDVDFDIAAGEVHALAGHNGSGKSTLVKILAGVHVPTAATRAEVAGDALTFGSSAESARRGLRFVHQDLALVPTVSVTENLALGLGYERGIAAPINWRAEHRRTREMLGELGYDVDPRSLVADLSASTRSAVAIARALSDRARGQAKVLVLDEVTATMPQNEVTRLLDLVKRLKATGIGVLYISHHLEELEEVADRVTVLRSGRVAARLAGEEITVDEMTRHILGGATVHLTSDSIEEIAADNDSDHAVSLRVRGLGGTLLHDLDFDAEPGAIVGISGVAGSGREEVAELIMGSALRQGTVTVGSHDLPAGRADAAMAAGVALVPADRIAKGLVGTMTIAENLTLSRLGPLHGPTGWIHGRRERREVGDWVQRLDIKGATADKPVMLLSGGNQQKVVLARCLRVEPTVLLLDEPTQGVDVGAIADIHALIKAISATTAVVVCSSDPGELAALCTEVLVLRKGRCFARLRGDDVTEERITMTELATEAAS